MAESPGVRRGVLGLYGGFAVMALAYLPQIDRIESFRPVARAALTAVVVIVPTVAMGATLPVLARVVASISTPLAGGSQVSTTNATPGTVVGISPVYSRTPPGAEFHCSQSTTEPCRT